ncbi:S8 family serine peptidase [Steroidobacter sp. S1-65]|uniref:S8 family serine peptidase n=1 Tax=Steroidobacter gossypii TaxID=2805490 RepID=A0ABS1WTV8_9GAMM|nr:S8 family serine peptidase [Steroidobacter gossypii]MBM0104411.1 S8 family serine peptidase [Steroidobacter gossypii]
MGPLSLVATAVLTVVAADASAAQRAAAASSKRLETRMPAPARAQLDDVSRLLRNSGLPNRVQVAVSLNTAAVGDGKGTSKADVQIEQTAFIGRLAQSAPSATVLGAVQLVANTVFLELDADEVAALHNDRAVTRVAPTGNYKRNLTETVPYIGAETLQGLGLTGKGVRVAVIDSGIDYTHASLGGEGTAAAYAAAWGTSATDPRNTTTDGLFPTAKVIGGFDFVGEAWTGGDDSPPLAPDPDPIAAPDQSTFGGHGTHVADIIAGKDGVAPDVKLYAIKACAVPTSACSGQALMMGFEWAVDPNQDGDPSDRADIINMSLGANYGQPFDDDLSAAVDRATKLGAFTVASAGNGSDKPFVTGSPAAAVTALSVAQTAVPSAVVDLMTIVSPAVTPAERGAIHQSWSPELTEAVTAPVVFTPSNALGCTPFPAGSLTGVIALVNRGTCAFADKIRNIQAGGALIGVIGMVDGTAPFDGAYQDGPPITIPGYMISLADANAIRSGATVRFDPDNVFPLISSVVSTSSRGPMFEDHRIKPEIGAPGASVSAMSGTGNQSDAFGGTSGAAPMVSGAAALLKELYPSIAPQRLKQLLINNAETGIEQPASASSVIPDSLAPISRIGGGEVRVDRAARATAGAYGFDLVKTGTRSGGVSFGFVDVERDAVLKRRVRVFNRDKKAATFKVRVVHRYANDVANGAVKIYTAETVTVPAKGDRTFDVTMAISGDRLRNNLMNAGPDGPNPVPLTLQEYDGYLVFEKQGSSERFSLPWHVLPRKVANTVLASGPNWKNGSGGVGTISLKNRGVGAAQLNTYSLLATSPNLPEGGRGEEEPTPDLRAVGVTTFPVPAEVCTSGYLWSFAVNMWERETLPVAVDHRIALDIDRDGQDDYWLLNRDVSLNDLSDGRQLAWSVNLATGDAEAFWFVEHPTNSATTVLNACLEQFGLTSADVDARRLIDVSVYADDFYFGGPGDAIEGLTIVPFGERYFAAPAGDLPAGASGDVTVRDFGQIPGTTKELGVMIQTDGDRCVSAGNCGGATQSTEVLLVAPPGGDITF